MDSSRRCDSARSKSGRNNAVLVRLASMHRLLLSACLLASCTTALPPPSVTATPTATARVSLRSVGLGNGLVVDVSVAWSLAGAGIVNRATQRALLAANVEIAALPTLPGNGDVDAHALASGQVTVELESFCRMACMGPADESRLPLDRSAAARLYDRALPAGRHELGVGFRGFDTPLYVVARWVDDAPASDIAAIADIARSIRPERPVPTTGEFNGWAGLGPLAHIPVGTVRFTPLPAGAVVQQPYRVWDVVPFFLVRGKQDLYASVSRPLHDQRCEIGYDATADRFRCSVDARTYEWTRFGRYLGPEPASDLSQHRVIVRDGLVWVHYLYDSLMTPSVRDDAAER